jgi:cytochrome c553
MDTGMLHSHTLVVVLYILVLLVLAFFIISGRQNAFYTIRAKLRIPRIALETLMLGTGVYLMLKAPDGFAVYNLIKYALIIMGIGLAVVAFLKMNKFAIIGSIIVFVYIFMLSKQRNFLLQPETERITSQLATLPPTANLLDKGKIIYTIACTRCHGETGESQFRKAKNLKQSVIPIETAQHIIKVGQNAMPAFAHLNDEQIQAVSTYIQKLKK